MSIYSIVKKYIDEYDLETTRISQRINIQSSILEIAETISYVFLHSMGSVVKADVTNPNHFLEVATKIKNEINSSFSATTK